MTNRNVRLPDLARLPTFSHATVAGDTIYVAGTLGTTGSDMGLVEGGMAAQTRQTLRNIASILEACEASLEDVVKVNVYITDMDGFQDMNAAYEEFFGDDPPARITVGCAGLALGALVEIDCVARRP